MEEIKRIQTPSQLVTFLRKDYFGANRSPFDEITNIYQLWAFLSTKSILFNDVLKGYFFFNKVTLKSFHQTLRFVLSQDHFLRKECHDIASETIFDGNEIFLSDLSHFYDFTEDQVSFALRKWGHRNIISRIVYCSNQLYRDSH